MGPAGRGILAQGVDTGNGGPGRPCPGARQPMLNSQLPISVLLPPLGVWPGFGPTPLGLVPCLQSDGAEAATQA